MLYLRTVVTSVGTRFIASYQPLIEAAAHARDTPGAAAHFLAVRNRLLSGLRGIIAAERSGAGTIPANADASIASIVNNNADAQAVIRLVNAKYPHGFLAQRTAGK
jgi:hypothetical protein